MAGLIDWTCARPLTMFFSSNLLTRSLSTKMKSTSVIVAAALVVVSYAYDIRQMDKDQRAVICTNQIADCNVFCRSRTDSNTCDVASMAWSCVCKGGVIPNNTEITFPVPHFQCTGSYEECVQGCTKNAAFGAEQSCIDTCGVQFKVTTYICFYLILIFCSVATLIRLAGRSLSRMKKIPSRLSKRRRPMKAF